MRRVVLLLLILIIVFVIFLCVSVKWSKLFSPGELSSAHAQLDDSGQCNACHTRGKQLDWEKCLGCHKEIKTKADKKQGIHGTASRDCILCHSEHHGRELKTYYLDKETFDHSRTGWKLEGLHALLKCEACHLNGSYSLDKTECVHCHHDIHLGQLGTQCAKCHNAETFNIISYKHQDTDKAPKGEHLQIICDECHKMQYDQYPSGEGRSIKYKGINFMCHRCHDDVHDGEHGKNCSKCHSQFSFEVE